MIKNYAIIENGVVVNIAVSEQALESNWIQSDIAQIGWTYDGTEFHAPPVPPAPYIAPIISKVAFRFRMTDAEYVGILQAAKTEIAVAAWVETFNMVSQVNLADARTIAGVQQLVDLDLLTEERAGVILTAPVQPSERP